MVYFYSWLENILDEDAKHHDTVLHQPPSMLLYFHLYVPVKVLHMHFSLPCSLLSLSSFLSIFYVISRPLKYMYMYYMHVMKGRHWRHFFFYTQNCLFTTLSSWEQAGNHQSHWVTPKIQGTQWQILTSHFTWSIEK